MNEQNLEIQDFFHKNGFVVIEKFMPEDMANLLYQYCITKVQRTDFMITFDKANYREDWDGMWGDKQIPGSFNSYGDPMMDTVLSVSVPMMSNYTGLDLYPTYTYWRFYETGDILEYHTDRSSCEISATLCLGYNMSNVDQSKYPNYNWPMFVKTKEGADLPIQLKPGDVIIYKGCEIPHWREKFIGLNQAQLFMHFNDKNGPYKILYDGRPILGIPKKFQAE